MDRCSEERKTLANEFLECRKVIIALGDETRQGIIMTLLTSDKVGLRVGEITEKTHLSQSCGFTSYSNLKGCRNHSYAA